MRAEVELLPDGLRFLHVPMPTARSVSVGLFVGVGSRYEAGEEAGVSHLLEHMMFKGTARRPQRGAISAAIDGIGGVQNAGTDKETTTFWVKVASEHAPLAVDLLADMVRHSLLRARDIRTEKSVILEELGMAADDPQDRVYVLGDELLWPGQPLGREIAGTPESVAGLTARHGRAHLARYYGSNNAVVSIAGGIAREEARDLVCRWFDGWEPVAAPRPVAGSVSADGARFEVDVRETEQTNLCLLFPGVAQRHPDRWALEVLLTILGGTGSSRLFQSLRDRDGLVYETHAYSAHYSDTGALGVYIGTDPAKLARAVGAAGRELRKIVRHGVTAGEIDLARRYYRGRLWLGLEDTAAVASWFGGQAILHHEVMSPDEAVAAVDAVTADDVQRVATRYLQPDEVRVSAVGAGVDETVLEWLG